MFNDQVYQINQSFIFKNVPDIWWALWWKNLCKYGFTGIGNLCISMVIWKGSFGICIYMISVCTHPSLYYEWPKILATSLPSLSICQHIVVWTSQPNFGRWHFQTHFPKDIFYFDFIFNDFFPDVTVDNMWALVQFMAVDRTPRQFVNDTRKQYYNNIFKLRYAFFGSPHLCNKFSPATPSWKQAQQQLLRVLRLIRLWMVLRNTKANLIQI